MGVHTLLYWKAGDGAGAQNAFDVVLNALVSLQGVQQQRWSAQAAALRQAQQQQEPGGMPPPAPRAAGRDQLQRVTFSDLPSRIFLLAKSVPPKVIDADAAMHALLDKYALSKQRAALQLEGWQYSLADFIVRVARAVQAPQQQFLGIVLDVAYQPLSHGGEVASSVLQDFTEILQEAVAAAGGTLHRQADICLQQVDAGTAFSPRHRALRYVQLMSDLAT